MIHSRVIIHWEPSLPERGQERKSFWLFWMFEFILFSFFFPKVEKRKKKEALKRIAGLFFVLALSLLFFRLLFFFLSPFDWDACRYCVLLINIHSLPFQRMLSPTFFFSPAATARTLLPSLAVPFFLLLIDPLTPPILFLPHFLPPPFPLFSFSFHFLFFTFLLSLNISEFLLC